MLDRERILAKLDELDGYLGELRQVVPGDFEEYMRKVEKKRACERVLQIAIQCVLDVCHQIVSGLRLGLPSEEDDMLEKLGRAGVLSTPILESVRAMKGFRNILVHEYGGIDDALVFKAAKNRPNDFEAFKSEVLQILRTAQ